MSKQPNVSAPNEEQVIEELLEYFAVDFRAVCPSYKPEDCPANGEPTTVTVCKKCWKEAVKAKLHSLGYRSPSEIRELERAAMERVIQVYDNMLDGMGYGEGNFKKSDWDAVEALKSELLEGK